MAASHNPLTPSTVSNINNRAIAHARAANIRDMFYVYTFFNSNPKRKLTIFLRFPRVEIVATMFAVPWLVARLLKADRS